MADEINSFTQSVYQLDYEGLDIPTPTDADEGKVLTAKGLGEVEWKNVNGDLPAIGESDEGKVLTVDEGEAIWASGGDSGIEVFEFDMEEFKINKSYNQLLSYMNDGKLVMGVMTFEDDGNTFTTAYILTQLIRIPNDGAVLYEARLCSISYHDGGGRAEAIPLVAEDPDTPMLLDV